MREFLISLSLGTNEIPKKYAFIYEQIKSCGAIENPQSKKPFFKLSSQFGIFCVNKRKITSKSTAKNSQKSTQIIFLQDIANVRDDIALRRTNTPKSLQDSLNDGDMVLALVVGGAKNEHTQNKHAKNKHTKSQHTKNKRTKKEFVRIIKNLSSHSSQSQKRLVYLEKQQGKIIGIDLKTSEIYHLPFSQKSLAELPKHCVLSYTNKPQIHKILGVLEEPKIDDSIALFLNGREEDFGAECRELARSFGECVEASFYPDRVDLRELDFISIDPSSAKDFDDSIFYDEKKRILYVAIADVSEYVQPKSALDMEAKSRCFSLYFPHKCYPMLPQELSENLCSLKANEEKLVLVCEIEFARETKNTKATKKTKTTMEKISKTDSTKTTSSAKSAEIKSCKIYEAIIKPKANVSYEYVDTLLDALESSKTSNAILEPLKNLANPKWILSFWDTADELKKERLKNGFDFFTKEREMILDKNGEIESIREICPTRSHSLIEEAMLLANVSVARILSSALDGRGIYRTHNPPTKDKLHALFVELGILGYEVKKASILAQSTKIHAQISALQSQAKSTKEREIIDRLIIKSQKEARYADKQDCHFGLGFGEYSHFTSPIRRYSDILAHRLIKLLLCGGEIKFAWESKEKAQKNGAKNAKSLNALNMPNVLNADKNLARHINFVLDSIAVAIPLLNDAERGIAKCEAYFKDRKYARSAMRFVGKEICVRIIDERLPAIGVVESIESSQNNNKAQSSPKSNIAEKNIAEKQFTEKNLAEKKLAILQGARVFVLECGVSLEKHRMYRANIAQIELGSGKIYVKIQDNISDKI